MEIRFGFSTAALMVLFSITAWPGHVQCSFDPLQQMQDATISDVVRQHGRDIFIAKGGVCNPEMCVGLSSGTATLLASNDSLERNVRDEDTCACQCHRHLPAFREDLHICVDDIHECLVAPFVSGSTSEQIPFVFLPLKGQIIHPSKEINFAGIQTPVCAVSGAKFLTESGWVDLRNSVDSDVPFRLFRDEGRTFLQWTGEQELRNKMSGRLILVHLMCREISTIPPAFSKERQAFFSPCVAFRVVGSPIKFVNSMHEVLFSAESALDSNTNGLSISEYVAIGICSVLLGFIYVASVMLYLHIRKRRRGSSTSDSTSDKKNLSAIEEGIVKNNPLLGLGRHFSASDIGFIDSDSSDKDAPDGTKKNDGKHIREITAALIHPQKSSYERRSSHSLENSITDQTSIERLPEENVSIVETLEGREDRPDALKAITGTARRKLYFNPAYFEPQNLLTPPPAAIEFLTKIREVITIAKQKMATKKYTPSLLGIPEEDGSQHSEHGFDKARPLGSRRGSAISLKRENSRRRTCTGCPGCEPQDLKPLCGRLPEFPSLAACHNCTTTANDSKQRSIQKWLQDIPILKNDSAEKPQKSIRSPARSLSPDQISSPILQKPCRPFSKDGASSPDTLYENNSVRSKPASDSAVVNRRRRPGPRRVICKPKAPPPPVPSQASTSDSASESGFPVKKALPPPDMISEAIAIETQSDDMKIPTITKKKMNAVISEFTMQKNEKLEAEVPPQKSPSYESDSLDRNARKAQEGRCTPTDYSELSSSQPSPSMSAALPMDEEMTMRNAIFNTKTGNMTMSKLKMEEILNDDDHDYELIVLKKGSDRNGSQASFYRLPKFLQNRSDGYSLVSEVYVNNGYNYSSLPSTPTHSNCSTMERQIREEQPGKLLIQVEDCPDNYIRKEDSDDFEPDTLDRKPKKKDQMKLTEEIFIDSLERPNQILLRSSGSFKNSSSTRNQRSNKNSNFNRNFGSLREIYEAKVRSGVNNSSFNAKINTPTPRWVFPESKTTEDGRILTLEERHSKRQRRSSPSVPPDVIPPPPHDSSPIYEHPKPPRKVILEPALGKPPLPPKNGIGRSTGTTQTSPRDVAAIKIPYQTGASVKNNKNNNNNNNTIQIKNDLNSRNYSNVRCCVVKQPKPEDSGYLSTDSNEGSRLRRYDNYFSGGSETEDSTCDAQSESGAESVETHSVFFGSFRKMSAMSRSADSGVGYDFRKPNATNITIVATDDGSSTDSETISYTTVVPFGRVSSRGSFIIRQ